MQNHLALFRCMQKLQQGLISMNELIDSTSKNNKIVFKKFHIIQGKEIPIKFFENIEKYKRNNKKIIFTDEIMKLSELFQYHNLFNEIESRWNLVEKSWELNISKNLLNVAYDHNEINLYTINPKKNLVSITSARQALIGYHKGRCFYCNKEISSDLNAQEDSFTDLDHFLPLSLEIRDKILKNLNGIWNLVLCCKKCNRGKYVNSIIFLIKNFYIN